MKITKYPDGTSYVTVNDFYTSDWITFRINTYEDLWHLNQFVDAYNFKFKQQPHIFIPNLLDAQADRRFAPNKSSGLKLVMNFIGGMNAKFKVFHPHNSEIVEGLANNIEIFDNKMFIDRVLLYPNFDKTTILMSSDAGGFKPLMKLCDKIKWVGETFSASKSRSFSDTDGNKFVQQIDRTDFQGKDILIIDDISIYGGTFKGLSKLLRDRNCGKLYLAVSHMTVENLGEDPVTNYFDKVFTTNSKHNQYYYHEYTKKDGLLTHYPENLEIIKLF